MPDALLTSQQVARQLGVSVRTVHRLVDAGSLKAAQRVVYGRNGALLYDPAEVRAYIARRNEDDAA